MDAITIPGSVCFGFCRERSSHRNKYSEVENVPIRQAPTVLGGSVEEGCSRRLWVRLNMAAQEMEEGPF